MYPSFVDWTPDRSAGFEALMPEILHFNQVDERSFAAIARKLGVSRQAVADALKRHRHKFDKEKAECSDQQLSHEDSGDAPKPNGSNDSTSSAIPCETGSTEVGK